MNFMSSKSSAIYGTTELLILRQSYGDGCGVAAAPVVSGDLILEHSLPLDMFGRRASFTGGL
jgi:hypothetical protein